jgi:acetyltransferase-like isoleucine patch superfamily enzyme
MEDRRAVLDDLLAADDLRRFEHAEAIAQQRVRREWFVNSVVNRVPWIDRRMALYQRLGVDLEDPASTVILGKTEIYGISGLHIGAGSQVNRGCLLDGRGGLRIGRHVAIAERVCIFTGVHDLDDEFRNRYIPVRIGDRALINARALIVPGVTLGEGAVVGAQAVVTRDVEPWTVVAGSPARVIKERRPDQTYTLTWRPDWR